MTIILTGWPFSPPAALTLLAHDWLICPAAASTADCGPEQLQIVPTTIGAPFAVETGAEVLAPPASAGPSELLFEFDPQALSPATVTTAQATAPNLVIRTSTSP